MMPDLTSPENGHKKYLERLPANGGPEGEEVAREN